MSERNDIPEVLLPNRGLENKIDPDDAAPISISLTKITETIMHYFSNIIKPTVTGIEVLSVPILYANPERWSVIQNNGVLKDPKNDKAQCPLITIRRTSVRRSDYTNPNNKYLYHTFETPWNKRNAYDKFAILNRVKPSEKMYHVIVPDYIDLTYEIILWTDNQSQMNELIEQINVENEEFWGTRNQFKFRTKITEYSDTTELPAQKDRVVRTLFNMDVHAYLIPEKILKEFRTASPNTKTYTIKKLVISSEIDGTTE